MNPYITFTKLFGLGFLFLTVMVATKIVFWRFFNWDDVKILHVFFLGWVIVWGVALIRRLGVINYLELMMAGGLWLVLWLLADAAVTAPLLGWKIFIDGSFLLGYLLVVVAWFIFHKKRHVHLRHELHAKHHGGH